VCAVSILCVVLIGVETCHDEEEEEEEEAEEEEVCSN
jgi:hypothetical protein